MAGIYSPSPAVAHQGGRLVLRSVERRFHAFMRCRAALFPVETREARAALAEAELTGDVSAFRDAVAYLSNTAVLAPFSGGAEVVLYLARPGKEEDFQEVAPDLEEDGLQRLASLPEDAPILVMFGNAAEVAALAAAPPEPEEEAAPAPEGPEPETAAQIEEAQEAPEPEVSALPSPDVSSTPEPPSAEVPHAAAVAAAPEPAIEQPEEPADIVEAAPPEAVAPEQVAAPAPVEAAEPLAESGFDSQAASPEAAPPPVEPALPPASVVEAGPEPAPQEPEPEEVPQAVLPPEPPAAPAPERTIIQPPPAMVHAPVALQLGDAHYALRRANTEGSTVVVWQARRLTAAPAADEFEVLQPSAALRQRLIAEANNGARFGDEGLGELVAVKIALPGREADLERALAALRRLGSRALRLYFPGPAAADDLWPPGFPCIVVEWAEGTKLSESALFSEVVGLEVCLKIAEILDAAQEAAPDIVLTESLRPDNIVFAYDDQARLHVRIIDWNAYGSEADEVRQTTLVRFGEIMARVFAPDMPFAVNWATGHVPLQRLAAGQPGDPGAAEWDALSYGTQSLIRRALQGDFEGDASNILRTLRQAIKDQQARWAEDDPLWQARLETGPARLNWLDMAAAKQGRLSAEARTRLDEERLGEIREIVLQHTSAGNHLEAVITLRTALRRHPREDLFRWAMLAHTIGLAGPPLTFRRLHLDEALAHLQAGRFAQAQNALERGAALFEDLAFEAEAGAEARRYMEALLLNAESLALAESALSRLAEDWRVEDAESRLALAEDLAGRSEGLARPLLTGRDATCQQKLADLRAAIAAFHEKHRGYDPSSQKREAAEQARQLNFTRLLDRARGLAARDQPDAWAAAQQLYERAADEYPDLWQADGDAERSALAERIARRKLADARRSLTEGNWEAAAVALAHALVFPATRDEALRLQAALAAYQRGEVELRQGNAPAALASFAYAAGNSPELRASAEALAAEARRAGGAAAEAKGQAASAAALEGLAEEMRRQLTEVSLALNGMLEEALSQVQENASQQKEALRQAQEDNWTRQQAALRALQEEQAARMQSLLGQAPAELAQQQQALLRQLHESQREELRATLIQLYDEQSGWQQETLKQIQQEQNDQRVQYRADLKKVQEEQNARLQAAMQKLQEDFLERQQAALGHLQDELTTRLLAREQREAQAPRRAPAAGDGPVVGPPAGEDVDELKSELQRQAANQADLANRTSRLMAVNILLVLLLALAVCVGAYSLGRPLLAGVRGQPAAEAPATAPSPLRSTSEATNLETEPTAAPAPTETLPAPTLTAEAPAGGALQCADTAEFRGYYDCTVSNPGDRVDSLSLFVQAVGGQANGFSPSVSVAGRGNALPDPATSLVPLGDFAAGEQKQVRLILSCMAAAGCPETTFLLSLWTDRGTRQAPGGDLRLTAQFPTAGQ